MKKIEQIIATQTLLLKLKREYVRSQQSLWVQVPGLALKAYGRGSGFSDLDDASFRNKEYVFLDSDTGCGYELAVDCTTGELVVPFFNDTNTKTQQRPEVCESALLLLDVEDMDATKVIEKLKKTCLLPNNTQNRPRGFESWQKWRQYTAKEFGIALPK